MYRVTNDSASVTETSIFDNFSKYLFIYDDHSEVIWIEFILHKYDSINDPALIQEINDVCINASSLIRQHQSPPLAIIMSDSHNNIVQFMFPFIYSNHVTRIDDDYHLVMNDSSIQIIHLGDYGLSNISRLFHEHHQTFASLNRIMLNLIDQLTNHAIFLCGNHDWWIHSKHQLQHHYVKQIGQKRYLFIHGPPFTMKLLKTPDEFKNHLFYRYNRHLSMAFNRKEIVHLYRTFITELGYEIDVVVSGHEQLFSQMNLSNESFEFIGLDCFCTTRCYFSYESDECDHPYLHVYKR